MSDAVKNAIEALELIAKNGRGDWEKLAEAIDLSEESLEILSFLQEIVQGEI